MKFLLLAICVLSLTSCSGSRPGNSNSGSEKESTTSRFFAEDRDSVLEAAKATLTKFARASNPRTSGAVKVEGDTVFTGWVYSSEGGRTLRRLYGFTVTPTPNGSHLTLTAEEEEKENSVWHRIPVHPSTFEKMTQGIMRELRFFR